MLDEFLDNIFTSINDFWFRIFLNIVTNYFVTKTRRFMLLICLSIRLTSRWRASINLFSDSFKISINDKRYRLLILIIVKVNFASFFWHFYPLCAIDNQAIFCVPLSNILNRKGCRQRRQKCFYFYV